MNFSFPGPGNRVFLFFSFSFHITFLSHHKSLRNSITTIDPEIGTGDILTGVREQKGDGTHEIDGLAHLALGNERCPLLFEFGVVV